MATAPRAPTAGAPAPRHQSITTRTPSSTTSSTATTATTSPGTATIARRSPHPAREGLDIELGAGTGRVTHPARPGRPPRHRDRSHAEHARAPLQASSATSAGREPHRSCPRGHLRHAPRRRALRPRHRPLQRAHAPVPLAGPARLLPRGPPRAQARAAPSPSTCCSPTSQWLTWDPERAPQRHLLHPPGDRRLDGLLDQPQLRPRHPDLPRPDLLRRRPPPPARLQAARPSPAASSTSPTARSSPRSCACCSPPPASSSTASPPTSAAAASSPASTPSAAIARRPQ
jgi:hypothetical protein